MKFNKMISKNIIYASYILSNNITTISECVETIEEKVKRIKTERFEKIKRLFNDKKS